MNTQRKMESNRQKTMNKTMQYSFLPNNMEPKSVSVSNTLREKEIYERWDSLHLTDGLSEMEENSKFAKFFKPICKTQADI